MYNYERYKAAIDALRSDMQSVEEAVQGLAFEYGKGGVSSRSPTHMKMLKESLTDMNANAAIVDKMINEHGYHHDKVGTNQIEYLRKVDDDDGSAMESSLIDLKRRAGIIVE